MSQKNVILILFVSLALVPFRAEAIVSFNPATEEEEIVFVSGERERNIGRNIDKQIEKRYNLPVDPLINKRIQSIGEKLAEGTDRKNIVYRFKVLAHKEPDMYNAFAAPGGYVYVFIDLVEELETDDRIAAVLAHEMGHVEAKHSVKRLQANMGITALMLIGTQMQMEKGEYAAANAAIGQLISAYSRSDERQADELSVKYMRVAGFDPNGTVEALSVLKKLRSKGSRLKYFVYKSHPYLSERMAYLKKYINGYTDFDSYINLVSESDN
ncbi:MAG: M48 family metalloprotease [Candidatus Omnitrophota bacterium]